MTLEEQNQIIKDSWTRQLANKQADIPTDIGKRFTDWVKAIIEVVRSKQQTPPEEAAEQQTQGGNA